MCNCNGSINIVTPGGPQGLTGNGVVGTAWTSNSNGDPQGTQNTTDTYTITYTNGDTDTFTVYNGADGAAGAPGSPGTNGAIGPYGGYSRKWRYEGGNTAGGIVPGRLRFNNNDFTLATTLYVYDSDIDSVNVQDFLDGFENDTNYGYIRIFNETDSTQFVCYKLTNIVDSGNYHTLTVEYIAMGSYFVYNDDVVLTFSPAGSPILSNNYLLYVGTPNVIGVTTDTNITDDAGVTFSSTALEEDPLSAFNPATGVWTCPATGYYDFSLLFAEQSGASATGYLSVGICKVGVAIVVCQNTVTFDANLDSVAVSACYNLRSCTIGETYIVKTLNRGAGAINNPSVHISIKRVK